MLESIAERPTAASTYYTSNALFTYFGVELKKVFSMTNLSMCDKPWHYAYISKK